LNRDLPTYIAAASGFSIDHGDVGDFTKRDSAGAERVFTLLKIIFRSNQNTTLADLTRGSIMLRYNNTKNASEARK
jgi:hypothetical protein